jgi:hypothetical protein
LLKSGEIAQKHDFTTDLTLSAQKRKCESLFPPAPGVKWLLAYYIVQIYNKIKTVDT